MQKKQQFVPKIPIFDQKLPNTARNYPILLTNTHFLPKNFYMFAKKTLFQKPNAKKQQFVPKMPISDQKLPNTARNYPILLTNTHFLPKKFYMFAKKNLIQKPNAKNTTIRAKNTHF